MVVPLQVVIGAEVLRRGPGGATPDVVAEALRDFVAGQHLAPLAGPVRSTSTSGLAATGPTRSSRSTSPGEMSGTFESAAARRARGRLPVHASTPGRSARDRLRRAVGGRRAGRRRHGRGGGAGAPAGAGRGHLVAVLRRHAGVPAPRRADRRRGRDPRRRAGGQAAAVRSTTAASPRCERVRTASRALARLEELAVEAAGAQPVDVCVAHLANPDRAEDAGRPARPSGSPTGWRAARCGAASSGAVLGAHVGPGMVAVCVAPR